MNFLQSIKQFISTPQFIWSFIAAIVILLFSFFAYYFFNAKNKKNVKAQIQLWFPRIAIAVLLVLQAALLIYMLVASSRHYEVVSWTLTGLSLCAAIYIASSHDRTAYKVLWIFLIVIFPVYGGLLYLITKPRLSARRLKNWQKANDLYQICGDKLSEVELKYPSILPQMKYLQQHADFPVFTNTRTKYLSPGEIAFENIKTALKKAKKYIFIEIFIIDRGAMWDETLKILEEKVKEGVDVRVLYDDFGIFMLLPRNYHKTLIAKGIKCEVFNKVGPLFSVFQNYRDHRKIISIDGEIAFTGGINIGDEYINAIEKHGHWKDCAIEVSGQAAWSLTLMFLQTWDVTARIQEDFKAFYPWGNKPCEIMTDGFVQPYADNPLNRKYVGENVYLQMINNAKKYLYITTPYLIIDDTMVAALKLAAHSGIDVRIITPHKWDQWLVHMATRSYYRELITAGVKVYEYTKGFIHAKTFVSDDTTATVGTVNLDFRSMYMNFECGVLLCGTKSVSEVKNDFDETLKISEQITLESIKNHWLTRRFQDILRAFAPLL